MLDKSFCKQIIYIERLEREKCFITAYSVKVSEHLNNYIIIVRYKYLILQSTVYFVT